MLKEQWVLGSETGVLRKTRGSRMSRESEDQLVVWPKRRSPARHTPWSRLLPGGIRN
jgi:hypothetical protein